VCTHVLDSHSRGVWSLTIAWNGRRLFSGSLDRTIRVWQRSSLQCSSTLQHHKGEVRALASVNGQLFRCVITLLVQTFNVHCCSCGDDHTIIVFDLETRTVRSTLVGHTGPVYDIKCNQDNTRLYSASYDQTIKV